MNANKMDKTAAAFTVASIGLTLYWTFTYSGPYRYLAELQLKWFGWYVPKLTVIVILLGFLGIAAVVKVVFRGAERPAPTLPQAAGTAAPATGVVVRPNSNAWLLSPYARLWVVVIPLGMGAYFYFNAARAGELQQLRVQDFGSGTLKSSIVYADVRGQLSRDYMMKDTYMYIPMLEPGSSGPAHVLVGVDKAQTKKYLQLQADSTFLVRGMVQQDLEGEVRVAFEKNNIPLAENCWVVHTGRDPKGDRMIGLIVIGIGLVFGVGLSGLLIYRDKKRIAATQAVRANA